MAKRSRIDARKLIFNGVDAMSADGAIAIPTQALAAGLDRKSSARLEVAALGKRQVEPAPGASARNARRPLRLLLVDDDPAVLHSTEIVLKLKGHSIIAAGGGQAGIDALRAARDAGEAFDVVITDLGMPYVDGNQVAREVKDLFPSMPVVLLTGWGRRVTNGDETPAHVDFVLPKPLELDKLGEVFDLLG